MDWIKTLDWKAWVGTVALIIIFREGAVWLMGQFNHPEPWKLSRSAELTGRAVIMA